MPPTSKIDAILTFASLHLRTCDGVNPITVTDEDTTIEGTTLRTFHQRCTCGAMSSVTLDVDEVDALRTTVSNNARLAAAMRRLGRRIVQ